MRTGATLALLILAVASCVDRPDYEAFRERLEGGATCAELFRIRNEISPDSPDVARMNEDLQSIECYSSTSTRAD